MKIRWRPASCDYIGTVRINPDGSTTRLPGGAAGTPNPPAPPTPPPQPPPPPKPTTPAPPPPPSTPAPSPPPNSNSGGGSNDEGSSGSKQKLPELSQCGGTSGNCKAFGGDSACIDHVFPGYECDMGMQCVRQSVYYWQCWGKDTTSKLGSEWTIYKPKPTDQCPTFRKENQQCGGKGGNCSGDECADKPVDNTCCEPSTACLRFDEWYWECRPLTQGSGRKLLLA